MTGLRIAVAYHHDYVVPGPTRTYIADKYPRVLAALRARAAIDILSPDLMPRAWLLAAHRPDYVDAVLSERVAPDIERRIGFPVTEAVARRTQRSVGGTWHAAQHALVHGYAANAAGGSHHARSDTGAGYCVFNDLAVAALRLIAEGDARSILIVDCDVHQGDGTAEILSGHPQIVTFSIHAERNFPTRKMPSTYDIALPDHSDDAAYMAALTPALELLVARHRPDLILYQAGVDVHADDKLGRLALTDAGLMARDTLVATLARTHGIALASVLGGGYGADAEAVAARHAQCIITLATHMTDG